MTWDGPAACGAILVAQKEGMNIPKPDHSRILCTILPKLGSLDSGAQLGYCFGDCVLQWLAGTLCLSECCGLALVVRSSTRFSKDFDLQCPRMPPREQSSLGRLKAIIAGGN